MHGCVAWVRTLIAAYSAPPAPPRFAVTSKSLRVHIGAFRTPVASRVCANVSRVFGSTTVLIHGSVRTGPGIVVIGGALVCGGDGGVVEVAVDSPDVLTRCESEAREVATRPTP